MFFLFCFILLFSFFSQDTDESIVWSALASFICITLLIILLYGQQVYSAVYNNGDSIHFVPRRKSNYALLYVIVKYVFIVLKAFLLVLLFALFCGEFFDKTY